MLISDDGNLGFGEGAAYFFAYKIFVAFVLWVDGAGSFLLTGSERLTIGRLGSSASPEIALRADIDGVHAELLRHRQQQV